MLFLMYLILLTVGFLTITFAYKWNTSNKLLLKLPGPPALPLLGHALLLNRSTSELWKIIRKYLNDYYPIVCMWIFSRPTVFIRHPDDIQVLVKSKTNINKAELFYGHVKNYGNNGFGVADAEKWHERRPLINQIFLRNHYVRYTAESTNKCIKLLVQQMLSWNDESIQNILGISMKFSFDVVCNSILSYDVHAVDASYVQELIKAMGYFTHFITYRSLRPYLKDWIVKCLLMERKLNRNRIILDDFLRRVIEDRRNYYKTNGINLLSDDLISSLKNSSDNYTKNMEVESSNKLDLVDALCIYNAKGLIDEAAIFEELQVMMIAGYDTVGLTITYTLLLLAENENEQNLARKEVTDIMKKSGNKLPISEVQNLKYLDRCLKESIRLFPSGPMIGRKLVEDTKFSNYVIPRNTDVFMCLYDLHRDPNFWSEPNEFNPDRFLPEFTKDRHPYAYLPFSGGLRNCIGQKHAAIEIKIAVAHILYNFYLKPVDFTRNLSFNVDMVLTPSAHTLRMKFIKIKQPVDLNENE